jgi:hypothetical protein
MDADFVGSTCRIFSTAAGIVLYIFKFMALRFSGLGSVVRATGKV